jgi:hypothetical protein
VERAVLALVVGPRDDERVAVAPDGDRLGRFVRERAVRALHDDPTILEVDLDPGGNGDRLFPDS